ncbi:MAG: CapA family protein [Candidatus Edwardsbacteria bacterium]|nr:CapA family protein [Candidatus Edwardsbacteria bacterium]
MKKTRFYAIIGLSLVLPACGTVRLDRAVNTAPDTVAVVLQPADTAATELVVDDPALPDSAPKGNLTVAAVGDIMMGSCYPAPLLPPEDGRRLFDDCREILEKADLAFGNLEGPLCDSGQPAKVAKNGRAYVFRTPTSFADNLARAGFDVMSLANNHANDFGSNGSRSTRQALENSGIQYTGKEGAVAEFNLKGVSVGVIALAAGAPPRSIVHPEEALSEIDSLARIYDILIVSIHGGGEGKAALHIKDAPERYLNEPRGRLIKFSHDAIDRGADLIIGHGPHVPRALEVYRDRLIAYSLGNFCTYGGMNLSGESGYAPLLWAELDSRGRYLSLRVHSFIQARPGGPKIDRMNRASELMRKLSLQDFPQSHPYQAEDL